MRQKGVVLMTDKRAGAKAQLTRLKSRQGILSIALVVGTVIALIFTFQNAAIYAGWSDAAYHTTVNITDLTWKANPANTTITITVNLTAHNPAGTRLALFDAYYSLYLLISPTNTIYLAGKSVGLTPSQDVYGGHDVTFTSTVTIDNNTSPQQVNAILSQTSHSWYVSGYAVFHSVYADVTKVITSYYAS